MKTGADPRPGDDPAGTVPPVRHHVLEAIEQKVCIRIDRHGVAHIDARTELDAYVAQGFNAARDRLWQIDLWRKRGLGLLAASFGPGYLAQDRASRLFLYRGDMVREWAAYGNPQAQAITHAFVAGINAYVELVEQERAPLPAEFGATRSTPQRWAAEDVVRIRSHGLVRNVDSEFARARVLAQGGDPDIDRLRRSIEPAHAWTLPPGLDVGDVGPDVLDVFRLATAAVTFSPERLSATLAQADAWCRVEDSGQVVADAASEGSNNWAIAPHLSATGRPLLASDPHRAYALPSLRYVVHLRAPGLDIIGAGEPMLPGVCIGHNERVAFGLTTFPADQEDLHVYVTHPEDPMRYRYDGAWEAMQVVQEWIPVRGEAPQPVSLRFTRHGPVIHEATERQRAFAVRTLWTEPGAAPYFASLAYQNAATVDEFEAALASWSVPSNNHVVADTQGHIAWFTAAKLPRRPNWDGLLPVPGDGRYEWGGFHASDRLPRAKDPAAGYVASANEMNLPEGDSRTLGVGYEWAEPFRAQRIGEVLRAARAHGLQDSLRLQTDTVSLPARRVIALLDLDLQPHGELAIACGLFRQWDHRLDAHSAAALLFEVWWTRHLRTSILAALAPDAALRKLLGGGDATSLVEWLEGRFDVGPDRSAAWRQELLWATLRSAQADCLAQFGADVSAWQWGRLHHGYFAHPLSGVAAGVVRDVGPVPLGGSGMTVMNTSYRPGDGRANVGASFRVVMDVGHWDNCVFVNGPGQSGDPDSRSYGDQLSAWANGEYFPLLFSREAIESATAEQLILLPAGRRGDRTAS